LSLRGKKRNLALKLTTENDGEVGVYRSTKYLTKGVLTWGGKGRNRACRTRGLTHKNKVRQKWKKRTNTGYIKKMHVMQSIKKGREPTMGQKERVNTTNVKRDKNENKQRGRNQKSRGESKAKRGAQHA